MPAESAWLTLSPHEARTAEAVFERMFPADPTGPGAAAIGVAVYLDRSLAGPYRDQRETYRLGLQALDRIARRRHGAPFAECPAEQQDALLAALDAGAFDADDGRDFAVPDPRAFFQLLRLHLTEGLFGDPAYGGNRDGLGWRFLGYPGIRLSHTPEQNLASEAVGADGALASLADWVAAAGEDADPPPTVSGYDPQRGASAPAEPADVVLVGMGAVGGLIVPILTRAGLRVVALEAGPWRAGRDFRPDELGDAFYCRANLSTKFMQEAPRWRRHAGDPTGEASFSLGRMVNGVGGSLLHYGTWLRRFHPHHFQPLTRVHARWGAAALPDGCTLADWPMTYDDLEPYFSAIEHLVGVAGDSHYPTIPRSRPYPMPPLRPFRMGEDFRAATTAMGLHPYPVPVGLNSVPYDGRPATRYTSWAVGIGPLADDRWHPALSTVPEALASGNLDLRTQCRVTRVLTDRDGHASGVEYVDATGQQRTQRARTVILASYTFENVRLLLLSGDARHPHGLGNNDGQVGKHFMTKLFSDVCGDFPDRIFNRHTGPSSQSIILDDYVDDDFDCVTHGFLGGATLSAENQALPIAIARWSLPPDVPTWGAGYKEHLRQWQHVGTARIQPEALPYADNYLDLDPHHRDRSGLGLPVVRITYALHPNEHRVSEWMEAKSEEILRAMGAQRTWRGVRFTGVISSHDLGGCRMGEDPAAAVVDPTLQVHDTPGLYVFGGATFPSCPGINPTLTMWALCARASEQLAARLTG
jgi:gluconate 2-dehydrogenase alpha chain